MIVHSRLADTGKVREFRRLQAAVEDRLDAMDTQRPQIVE
jgi:hypothetical protein